MDSSGGLSEFLIALILKRKLCLLWNKRENILEINKIERQRKYLKIFLLA